MLWKQYSYILEDSSEDDENSLLEEETDDSSNDDDDDDEEEDSMDNEEMLEFTRNMKDEPGSDSGCTAVVALLKDKKLWVANAGDSRCVVCRNGKIKIVFLSTSSDAFFLIKVSSKLTVKFFL